MGCIGITEPTPIRRDYWSTKTRRIEPGGIGNLEVGDTQTDVPDIAEHVYGAQIVLRPIAIMQDTQKDQREKGKADEVTGEPFVNADRLGLDNRIGKRCHRNTDDGGK